VEQKAQRPDPPYPPFIAILEKWSKKSTRQKSYKGSREKVTKQREKKKN